MVRKWLVDLRKEKGLTCRELGERIGVSEVYMFNLEHGTRCAKGMKVSHICKIAEATGSLAIDLLQAEIDWTKEARE